jgi:hypothetical protein
MSGCSCASGNQIVGLYRRSTHSSTCKRCNVSSAVRKPMQNLPNERYTDMRCGSVVVAHYTTLHKGHKTPSTYQLQRSATGHSSACHCISSLLLSFWTLSIVRISTNRKHNVSETGSVSIFRREGGHLLYRKTKNLPFHRHRLWKGKFFVFVLFVFSVCRNPDDGQSPEA